APTTPPGRARRCGAGRRGTAPPARRARLYDLHSCQSGSVEGGGRWDPGEGRRSALEAESSAVRLAPSTGAPGSNGILRPAQPRPRMHKLERGHRLRGSRPPPSERSGMRFVGIDIAAETHVMAAVDESAGVVIKATPFSEDVEGYEKLFALLGD